MNFFTNDEKLLFLGFFLLAQLKQCCHRVSSTENTMPLFLCFIVSIFDASFFLLYPLLFDEDGELKDLNPEGLETKKPVGRFPKGTHFKNFTAFQPSSLFVGALLLS